MIKTKFYLCLSVFGIILSPLSALSQTIQGPFVGEGGSSISAAAVFTNETNGSVSVIAVQSTLPSSVYASEATATLVTRDGTVANGDVVLTGLKVNGVIVTNPASASTVESEVAELIAAPAATLNDRVSLIRAWRSGGMD